MEGYTHHFGYPRLRCSKPWNLLALQSIDPAHPAVRDLDEGEGVFVEVVWGNVDEGEFTLSVNRIGEESAEIASVTGEGGMPLAAHFDASLPGCWYVAHLRSPQSPSASRHLHMLGPMPSAWRNHADTELTTLRASIVQPSDTEITSFMAPVNLSSYPSRGFGIELELRSLPADPEHTDCFTKAAELKAALQNLEENVTSSHERQIVNKLQHWAVNRDSSNEPFTPEIALALAYKHHPENISAAVGVMSSTNDGLQNEYKSPPPPNELSFQEHAALEIPVFVRVLKRLGVCAPSYSLKAEPGCEMHVHVNVLNPDARGPVLTAKQLFCVWVAWVQFDLVIARFARSWMWCDRWAGPLFATGAEFTWEEIPWLQGQVQNISQAQMYDVPTFFLQARERLSELVHVTDPDASDDAKLADVKHVFGNLTLGKYCSLNLDKLFHYGTLEFRRQHSSHSETFITHWAHFCVSFVECFSNTRHMEHFLHAPVEESLATLQKSQEQATLVQLQSLLTGHVASSTLQYFLHQSCGAHHEVTNESLRALDLGEV